VVSREAEQGVAILEFPAELQAAGTRGAPYEPVAQVSELSEGSMRRVTRGDLDILLARTDRGLVAVDDRCPHMSAPLSLGALDGCVVDCPLHSGRFDLASGVAVQFPRN
jgi:nitrite reductase/ring-hydroxylating ferredoxin subunit